MIKKKLLNWGAGRYPTHWFFHKHLIVFKIFTKTDYWLVYYTTAIITDVKLAH